VHFLPAVPSVCHSLPLACPCLCSHAAQAQVQPGGSGSSQAGAAEPAWKTAAARVAAAASGGGAGGAGAGGSYQQQQYGDGYNVVPPPSGLSAGPAGGRGWGAGAAATAGRGSGSGFSIRPQLPKQKPAEANPLVAAFNQAASKLASSGVASGAAPAYTRVQMGGSTAAAAQQQQQQPVAPQQWPPALKAYVERSFKDCDLVSAQHLPAPQAAPSLPVKLPLSQSLILYLTPYFSPCHVSGCLRPSPASALTASPRPLPCLQRQRPKLQEVLKTVIGDAQATGKWRLPSWGAAAAFDSFFCWLSCWHRG
jgi:hypothetical protein